MSDEEKDVLLLILCAPSVLLLMFFFCVQMARDKFEKKHADRKSKGESP